MRTIVIEPGRSPALLCPPRSKSDAHRVLVLAHVLGRDADVGELAEAPADVQVLARGLASLRRGGGEIDCADGGAPFRFLVTQAAVRPGAQAVLVGTPRLGARPHEPLYRSLRAALGPGGLVLRQGDPWPVEVRGASERCAPLFRIDGSKSSQYASSLALGCAALVVREQRPWTLLQEGELASAGYLELTLRWMERAGFVVTRDHERIVVERFVDAGPLPPPPGDWSSIGYLLALAWKTGSSVLDVDLGADHPDRAVVAVLQAAGIRLVLAGTTARVEGTPHGGLCASGAVCPDLLPTLAAWACVLPGPSVFECVEILRDKESDRLAGIVELVSSAGGRAELDSGGRLLIAPPAAVRAPLVVDSHGDHRLAMAATVLSVLAGVPLHLTDPDCVTKSFPGFWAEVAKLQTRWR